MKNHNTLADKDTIEKTTASLAERGYVPEVVATKEDALARIKELIPAGASVMNGSSRTLEEIGFVEYLKGGEHGWKNLHADILAEKDETKQAALRKQSVLSDFYLGSVHALAETGEIVIASNSGSQLPHIVYTSPNIIFVVSTKKITKDFAEAMKRVEEHVFPLEDARMKKAAGHGSFISKLLVLHREPGFSGRKVHILLVEEDLGF